MTIREVKYWLISFLMAGSIYSAAQEEYRLEFTIRELQGEKLWLAFYYGDQKIRIDTAVADNKGNLFFNLSGSDETGMYRLERDQENGLDFLFNKENMKLLADRDFSLDGIEVSGSRENEIFFDYYRHKYDLESRLEILGGFLRYYPSTDTIYFTVAEHAEKLAGIYREYLDSLLADYGNLLVAGIIRFDQLPDIRPGDLDEMTRDYYRGHYFDGIDLRDTLYLYTPLLPVKIIDYLSLYVQPGISRENQEGLFIRAVDSLMKFTEGGPKVREMVVNYLIDGFQAYGFEAVLTHLVENYVLGQSCVSDQQEEKLKIRIEGFKKLAIGTVAPDFEITDSRGQLVKLSSFRGRKVLLIFWSGDCPHCRAVLPELNNLHAEFNNKVEFIGISVDGEDAAWRKALEEEKLRFVNVAELKGWDGQIIQDYFVYATPTFLLVDPSGRIAAKPAGIREIRDAFEK